MTIEPRKVLVVGGNGGIGAACAERFAQDGARVALIARAARSGRFPTHLADVADASAVSEAVAAAARDLGGLDVVVHAVGAPVDWRPIHDLDAAGWAGFIATDLIGTFNVLQAAIRQMRGTGGAIVAISSIAARMCQPRNSQGAAAKAGVEALIRVAAREEGRHGIRVNAVSIGITGTAMGYDAIDRLGQEATQRMIRGFPIPRIGDPAEIAGAVAFLAGDEGAYVTGQVLQVDGGQLIVG